MNPMQLLQLKSGWEQFRQNHPKFPLFMNAVSQNALAEGTIIEIKVTSPDGKNYSSNIKLTKGDTEFMGQMNDLFHSAP